MNQDVDFKRAVCLNCIDGRVQLPVLQWIKDNFPVDHVDMITEPGIDGVLPDGSAAEDIYRKLKISIDKNSAKMIFIAGHHDCKGNPVSDDEHQKQIRSSVDRLQKDFLKKDVIGLWVNQNWNIEQLT